MQRRATLADWLIRAALTLVFLATGQEKFSSNPHSEWLRIFAQIGFGDWFRYFTGVVEILGGLLLLIPPLLPIGAGLLVATMLGAIAAHIFYLGDPFSSIIPLGLIAAVSVVFIRSHRKAEDEEMTRLEI